MQEVKISGELSAVPAMLTLMLDNVDAGAVYGRVAIELPESGIVSILPIELLGFDIEEFCAEAENACNNLSGTAKLSASAGTFELEISYLDSGQSIIIRAQTSCELTGPEELDSYLKMQFAGFVTDQTYFSTVATQLRCFVREFDVSTSSPWLP